MIRSGNWTPGVSLAWLFFLPISIGTSDENLLVLSSYHGTSCKEKCGAAASNDIIDLSGVI